MITSETVQNETSTRGNKTLNTATRYKLKLG